MTETYRVPRGTSRVEQTIKRSRFIATLAHAPDAEAARCFVGRMREEFPDASHHCWACVAGPGGDSQAAGMSDDGEPRGTAGAPMLNTLLHAGIGEIAAVVVRYYGGTKLGTGGLVRAYSGVVVRALAELKTELKHPLAELKLEISYAHEDSLRRLLATEKGCILKQEYGSKAWFRIQIPSAHLERFKARIMTATAGRVQLKDTQP